MKCPKCNYTIAGLHERIGFCFQCEINKIYIEKFGNQEIIDKLKEIMDEHHNDMAP